MQEKIYYDDEINLREIAQTLLKGWKTILLLTLFVGAIAFGYSKLQKPVYEAKSLISVNQEALGLSISPTNFLLSDFVRQDVANELGTSIASLPSIAAPEQYPTIVIESPDKGETIYTIKIQSENAQEAKDIANTWVDVGIESIIDSLSLYDDQYLLAERAVAEANQALAEYLDNNGLLNWSWADLSLLTGFGTQPTVLLTDSTTSDTPLENESTPTGLVINSGTQNLPSISAEQRVEIVQLMRAQQAAEAEYNLARARNATNTFSLAVQSPIVINYAAVPEKPISPNTLINTALGLVLGGMLGIFWVFVAGWWKNNDTAKER